VRQRAFLQPAQEHDREFQALGAVQGQQGGGLDAVVADIHVADQGDLGQEFGQVGVLVIGGALPQGEHVLPAIFALAGAVAQVGGQPRVIDHGVQDGQGRAAAGGQRLPVGQQPGEGFQSAAGTRAEGRVDAFQQGQQPAPRR